MTSASPHRTGRKFRQKKCRLSPLPLIRKSSLKRPWFWSFRKYSAAQLCSQKMTSYILRKSFQILQLISGTAYKREIRRKVQEKVGREVQEKVSKVGEIVTARG